MAIWKETFAADELLKRLNQESAKTLMNTLQIRFSAVGEDWLEATLPVESRIHQPEGLLHGGASVALAESLGGAASSLCIDRVKQATVGVEINANHIRSVRSGLLTGRATALRVGKRMQVWEIKIHDETAKLICVSRITIAVVDRT